MLAIAAVAWAPLAAHTAALVTEVRAQPHVRITPILGVGKWRLVSRYILPAVIGPVFRHAMLRLPGIALALAALGFLGLGPRPPAPEWGIVLAEGMPYVERAPWAVLIPVSALALLSVLAVTLSSLVRGRIDGDRSAPTDADETDLHRDEYAAMTGGLSVTSGELKGVGRYGEGQRGP